MQQADKDDHCTSKGHAKTFLNSLPCGGWIGLWILSEPLRNHNARLKIRYNAYIWFGNRSRTTAGHDAGHTIADAAPHNRPALFNRRFIGWPFRFQWITFMIVHFASRIFIEREFAFGD